jgi:hypothetical protein
MISSLAVIVCSLYACSRAAGGRPGASAVNAATPPDGVERELKQSKFCSDAAANFWNRHNWKDGETGEVARHTYTNHFNKALNKCLVDVHGLEPIEKGQVFETDHIYDALENKVLAARLITKKNSDPGAEVVRLALIKDGQFVKNKEEVATFMPWFEGLMTQ